MKFYKEYDMDLASIPENPYCLLPTIAPQWPYEQIHYSVLYPID
jgi:hypothetical protein